jgi:hypothetical protein
MTQVMTGTVSGYTGGTSAIQPELWSSMVQVPLYKSLVALEVANMKLSDTVKYADTVHVPRFASLSAQTYTPGLTLSASLQDWAFDNLVVSSYKHVTFYVDDAYELTVNVSQARELATEAAYQLKNKIDQDVFKNITGTDGFYTADNQDILGGTNGAPVSAGSANIINIFSGARKFLRQNDVEETGDWCAVVTPQVASYIETKAATVGFNVADATLRNGYAGDFMGFQVYVSNNLPSGNLSAISPAAGSTASNQAAIGNRGGPSGANASGTTPARACYFGKKGTIDVVMMRAPALEIRKKDDLIGSNYITWTVYGSALFLNNAKRGINLSMPTAFTG